MLNLRIALLLLQPHPRDQVHQTAIIRREISCTFGILEASLEGFFHMYFSEGGGGGGGVFCHKNPIYELVTNAFIFIRILRLKFT